MNNEETCNSKKSFRNNYVNTGHIIALQNRRLLDNTFTAYAFRNIKRTEGKNTAYIF